MSEIENKVTDAAASGVTRNGNGGNGTHAPDGDGHTAPEGHAPHALARRYRLPYVDLLPPVGESPIDYALLGEIPVDLMLRHLFVPLRREGRRLHIAMADPRSEEHTSEIASALRSEERR